MPDAHPSHQPSRARWEWPTATLAAVIFLLCLYRAATLAFTIDEASTYVIYVHHGWQGIFHGPFDANNHILYSILEKLTRQWFGMSELALRLPALVGAGLFLWSLQRLCTSLVTGLWFQLLSFLLVAGNPLTLDLLVAARGYGLALGLLACALVHFIEGRRILLAGVALGVAVAANLIFTVPVIAALAVFLFQDYKRVLQAIVPAILIPLALWWLPFQAYNKDAFYFGAKTIYDSMDGIENALFIHNLGRGDPFANWLVMYELRVYVLPIVTLILWIGAAFVKRLRFLSLVFALTCFGHWLAHVWLGVLYPQERTGLALVFLFLFVWTAFISNWWQLNRYTKWGLAFPNLLIACVFLMQFVGQFDPRYFGAWRVNWKMNEAMAHVHQGKLRTHWIYQSTAEYYRLRWKLDIPPIVREPDKFELIDADYFLLPLPSQDDVAATRLRVVYRDEFTGTTLLQK